ISGVPLFFEQLRPETEPASNQSAFVVRGQDYQFLITPTEAEIVLRKITTATPFSPLERDQLLSPRPLMTRGLRMEFVGANAQATVHGIQKMPGKINYLIGNDPAEWHTGVPMFAKVQVDEIYPGIDMIYYPNQQRLEYDFVIAPGADPESI